jgi:hypothetical protein
MVTKKVIMLFLLLTVQGVFGAHLEIENKTRFTLEIQPVVDNKDASTMDIFKYTVKPGSSVSYNSGFYSIKSLRWRINNYFDNNHKLARNYFLAKIPGDIGVTNINAKIVILPNGDFRYYVNKKNSTHYIELTPLNMKYIYFNGNNGWMPLYGQKGNEDFLFHAEMANDIYR